MAIEKAGKLMDRRVRLISLGAKLNDCNKKVADIEAKLSSLSGVDRAIELISEAEKKFMRLRTLTAIKDKLVVINRSVQDAHDKAFYWEQRVAELEGAYRDKLMAAGQCPLCGGQIEPERLKEVV